MFLMNEVIMLKRVTRVHESDLQEKKKIKKERKAMEQNNVRGYSHLCSRDIFVDV